MRPCLPSVTAGPLTRPRIYSSGLRAARGTAGPREKSPTRRARRRSRAPPPCSDRSSMASVSTPPIPHRRRCEVPSAGCFLHQADRLCRGTGRSRRLRAQEGRREASSGASIRPWAARCRRGASWNETWLGRRGARPLPPSPQSLGTCAHRPRTRHPLLREVRRTTATGFAGCAATMAEMQGTAARSKARTGFRRRLPLLARPTPSTARFGRLNRTREALKRYASRGS
ncbi:hypothetical protein PsYK624_058660 [Phanerochaete sordida]|uniref:Uncharacterized protein n=1 Tax=Phanerochaete sordida TaxID=48140 RepID=A0A9P3G8H3_9APHY|nr:hypothetical protein PsYK624_058660 [Phanerochaete sordida]